jgi:hypothetical protein
MTTDWLDPGEVDPTHVEPASKEDPKMRHLGWLIAFVAALAAMWWAGLRGITALVTLVCGLAGIAYLVVRTQRPPLRAEQAEPERDTRNVIEGP